MNSTQEEEFETKKEERLKQRVADYQEANNQLERKQKLIQRKKANDLLEQQGDAAKSKLMSNTIKLLESNDENDVNTAKKVISSGRNSFKQELSKQKRQDTMKQVQQWFESSMDKLMDETTKLMAEMSKLELPKSNKKSTKLNKSKKYERMESRTENNKLHYNKLQQCLNAIIYNTSINPLDYLQFRTWIEDYIADPEDIDDDITIYDVILKRGDNRAGGD